MPTAYFHFGDKKWSIDIARDHTISNILFQLDPSLELDKDGIGLEKMIDEGLFEIYDENNKYLAISDTNFNFYNYLNHK